MKQSDIGSSDPHEVIDRVCHKMKQKYSFPGYPPEDIYQEAYIMCLAALPKYNGSIPLEHFLLCHLSNRLKNLQRDKNNFRRAAILHPKDLDGSPEPTSNYEIEPSELRSKIDAHIPAEYRMDYLSMLSGVEISPSRKTKIRAIVRSILTVL